MESDDEASVQAQSQSSLHSGVSSLQCPVCYKAFDASQKKPTIIPICGHTFCKDCIFHITGIDPAPKCPLCNKKLPFNVNYPPNFSLISQLEYNSKWEKCELHGKGMKLICINDNLKLCEECWTSDEGILSHEGHIIEHLENIKKKTDKKKRELEENLGKIITKRNDIYEFSKNNSEKLKVQIENKYRDLILSLEQERNGLLVEVDQSFIQVNEIVESLLGEGSKLKKEIDLLISQLENFLKSKHPLQLLKMDISSYFSDTNNLLTSKQFEGLNQQIESTSLYVAKALEQAGACLFPFKLDLQVPEINLEKNTEKSRFEEKSKSFILSRDNSFHSEPPKNKKKGKKGPKSAIHRSHTDNSSEGEFDGLNFSGEDPGSDLE